MSNVSEKAIWNAEKGEITPQKTTLVNLYVALARYSRLAEGDDALFRSLSGMPALPTIEPATAEQLKGLDALTRFLDEVDPTHRGSYVHLANLLQHRSPDAVENLLATMLGMVADLDTREGAEREVTVARPPVQKDGHVEQEFAHYGVKPARKAIPTDAIPPPKRRPA